RSRSPMRQPDSSNTSRRAASGSDSPNSTRPPGSNQLPANGPRRCATNVIVPSGPGTMATAAAVALWYPFTGDPVPHRLASVGTAALSDDPGQLQQHVLDLLGSARLDGRVAVGRNEGLPVPLEHLVVQLPGYAIDVPGFGVYGQLDVVVLRRIANRASR